MPTIPKKTIKNPERIANGNPTATAISPAYSILPSKPPATLHAIKNNTPSTGVRGDQKYDQNFFITKESESLSPVFSPLANSRAARRVIAPAKTDQIIINPRTKTIRTTYSPHSTLFMDEANVRRELHRPSLGEIKNLLIISNGVISTNLNAEPKASITKTQRILKAIPTKAQTSLLKSSATLTPRRILLVSCMNGSIKYLSLRFGF